MRSESNPTPRTGDSREEEARTNIMHALEYLSIRSCTHIPLCSNSCGARPWLKITLERGTLCSLAVPSWTWWSKLSYLIGLPNGVCRRSGLARVTTSPPSLLLCDALHNSGNGLRWRRVSSIDTALRANILSHLPSICHWRKTYTIRKPVGRWNVTLPPCPNRDDLAQAGPHLEFDPNPHRWGYRCCLAN